MAKLFLITPLLAADLPRFMLSFAQYLSYLDIYFFGDAYQQIIVIQGDAQAYQTAQRSLTNTLPKAQTIHQEMAGVSAARNAALMQALAVAADDDRIIFADAGVAYSEDFFRSLAIAPAQQRIIRASHNFGRVKLADSAAVGEYVEHDVVGAPYIWAMAFSVAICRKLEFDTNYGPGAGSRYPAGEDVLFLAAALKLTGWRLTQIEGGANHDDASQRLDKRSHYARGQIKVIKRLMMDETNPLPVRIWAMVRFLFFVGGTLRFVFRSWPLFKARCAALLVLFEGDARYD